MEAIETARKKVKALIKLAVDSYRRRDMVADLGRFELEEKSYSSLSNELNGVCVGTADAKLGIGTFTNVLGLACRKPGEPLERGATSMPRNPSVHLVLAATCVELNRMQEARAAVGRALEASPGYKLDEVHFSAPYADPAKLERYLHNLRAAGMPE